MASPIQPAAKKELKRIDGYGLWDIFRSVWQRHSIPFLMTPKKLRSSGVDFTVNVREVYVSAGAGFVVAVTGAIMTMPGLPKIPAAYGIDVDANGTITGLF